VTDEERTRRIGVNEAIFRELNEQIEDLAADSDRQLKLVCECGDVECHKRFRMAPRTYEALRADSCLFAVVPGHQAPDVETVQDGGSGYVVVRKHDGLPAAIARSTDPRR
jgi:hypothetical protein